MEDRDFIKNFQLYIEKVDFNVQRQGEMFKSLNIQSYSKQENTAKMLIRFEIQPQWLDHHQILRPNIIPSLFDVSSAAFHFLTDTRHATSINLSTTFLHQALNSNEIILDLSLQKHGKNLVIIKMKALSNKKLIAKALHTKMFISNTNWVPKL
jgi:predicted transcriptional regulator